MVVVIAHEQSASFLDEGFLLVDRANALVFDDAPTAAALLARYASEPCYAIEELTAAA
jgi:hypothetical protein